MDKVYAPHAIERRLYERWESNGWFAPRGDGAPYCIMIPPPNVTGTLHMGHAFQHTLMDALSRYQRMRGRSVLWQPGTDHAGIATQMVVERQLNAEGVKRTDLTRAAFLERVWAWKEQSGGTLRRSSTAASAWSTGIRYCSLRSPTWRCSRTTRKGSSGTCAIRSHTAT